MYEGVNPHDERPTKEAADYTAEFTEDTPAISSFMSCYSYMGI